MYVALFLATWACILGAAAIRKFSPREADGKPSLERLRVALGVNVLGAVFGVGMVIVAVIR